MKREYALAAVSVLFWGTAAPVSKLVLSGMPELMLMFFGTGLSFLSLLAVNLGRIRRGNLRRRGAGDYAGMAALGFVGLFLYNFLYYRGIVRLTSVEACIVNYMWPVLVVVFSIPVLKEKLTLPKAAGIAVSFAGLLLIATQGSLSGFAGTDLQGLLCSFLGAVCYGLFCVLSKRADYDAAQLMCVSYLVCSLCSGALCAASGQLRFPTGGQWLGILWMALLVDALSYVCWCTALNRGDTARISNLAYFAPFLSVLFGKLLLDETVTAWSLGGLALIISGVLVQAVKIRRSAPMNAQQRMD